MAEEGEIAGFSDLPPFLLATLLEDLHYKEPSAV
jgi:hypothetical protein